ncbi:MAG: YggS family pyridoxal phosphate-dependent enzyme [Flavobacteriaceae bacterium]|nr:YggS family pyridoxal phosphate-dependent enzyme [Flavobacteriaceae bacterium]
MNISFNLNRIKKEIPSNVLLVAVSKTKPSKDILIAYNAGQYHFGENKIQELVKKHNELPKEIKWHMIGHLQRNKVKYIAPFIHLIHSVDSLKLLNEINKQGQKNNRKINVLIQIDISNDLTKFGFSFNEINELFVSSNFEEFEYISVKGFMGMASFTNDKKLIRNQFINLSNLYEKFKKTHSLKFLSMGMSSDYLEAIECNSNIIRLGSNIFGKRS